MSIEDILKKARAVVINKETKYMKELCSEYNGLVNSRPTEAEVLLKDIVKENKRLHPRNCEKFDEEEFYIGKWIKGRR